MNTENSKTNEPHKVILNLSQRIDLRSSNTCCSSKRIYLPHVEKYKKQYKNN